MCKFQAVGEYFRILTTLDPSIWRKRARIVAYLQIVVNLLGLLYSIGFLTVVGYTIHHVATSEQDAPAIEPDDNGEFDAHDWLAANIKIVFIIAVVDAAMTSIEIWATIMLLNATKLGTDPKIALERCQNWRYLTIVLTILSALFTGLTGMLILDVAIILFQIVFVAIVSMFIVELKKTVETVNQGHDDFVQVTV